MKNIPSTKPQPTTAMLAVGHVAQSAGLSGLVSLLVGIAQYLTTAHLDWNTLFSVLGGGFLTALTLIWKSISSNPNLSQAALDTANLALQKIEAAAPWLAQDIAKIQAQKPVAPKPIPYAPPAQDASQLQTNIIPTAGGGGYYQQPQIQRQSTPQPVYQQQPQQQFSAGLSYAEMNRAYVQQNPSTMSFLQENPPAQQGG